MWFTVEIHFISKYLSQLFKQTFAQEIDDDDDDNNSSLFLVKTESYIEETWKCLYAMFNFFN